MKDGARGATETTGQEQGLREGGRAPRELSAFALISGLIVITAIAAAARLYHLDRPSFWGDELRSIRSCSFPVPEDRTALRVIAHSATIAGLWADGVDLRTLDHQRAGTWRAHGINEWNARIGPAIMGILTVPILILASRRMIGTGAAMLAGLLLALAPWHILWSQAARFYSTQFLFYTLCLIFYFRWRKDRTKRLAVMTAAALVLAFLAQPISLVALAVIGVDVAIGLIRREIRFTGREVAVMSAGAGVCLGLLVYYLFDHPDAWQPFIAFTGEYRHQLPATLLPGTLYMVQFPIAAVAGISALWLLKRDRPLAMFLMLAVAMPLLVMSIASMYNFIGLRYLLITLWWWLALASIGLVALYRAIEREHGRWLALAPATAAIFAAIVPLHAYYEDAFGYRGRWREAMAYVRAHMQPHEKVATTRNQLIVAEYYLGRDDVREMKWTLPEMTEEFATPTWLVFMAETSVRGREQEWTREGGTELHGVFDLRVPQPIETVQVHRFLPTPNGGGLGEPAVEMAAKKDE